MPTCKLSKSTKEEILPGLQGSERTPVPWAFMGNSIQTRQVASARLACSPRALCVTSKLQDTTLCHASPGAFSVQNAGGGKKDRTSAAFVAQCQGYRCTPQASLLEGEAMPKCWWTTSDMNWKSAASMLPAKGSAQDCTLRTWGSANTGPEQRAVQPGAMSKPGDQLTL